MELTCVLCLYQKDRKLHNAAVTVLEGYAVCEPHLPLVARGPRWRDTLAAVNAAWDAWQAQERPSFAPAEGTIHVPPKVGDG